MKLAWMVLAPLVICSAARAGELWLIADRSTCEAVQPVWVSVAFGELFPLASEEAAPPPITHINDLYNGTTERLGPLRPQDRNLSIRGTLSNGLHVLSCESSAVGGDGRRIRRFAKTIVRVGDFPKEVTKELPVCGQDFEIVPLSDPSAWQCGTTLRFRVLLEGFPWAGVSVCGGREGMETGEPQWSGRTDARGDFEIPLSMAGHAYVLATLDRPRITLTEEPPESLRATFSFHVLSRKKNPAAFGPVVVNRTSLSP